jgi:hypothetical protein
MAFHLRGRSGVAILGVALFVGLPVSVWPRIPEPEAIIDLTGYTASPVVFRGTVLDVSPALLEDTGAPMVARFQVDRWYRNPFGVDAAVHFTPYSLGAADGGHNCIDFKPGTHWLVFATNESGHLELVDDCEGAVRVSPLLDNAPARTDPISQMEADFTAGLEDGDPAARIISIQRLGGLKLASSRSALQRVIENGSPDELEWGVYAALRTGDTSVLPKARDLLRSGKPDGALFFIPLALDVIKDKSATAGLIEIADSPDTFARLCAISALGKNIKAVEALPVIASHLNDPDRDVRGMALNGMEQITHEPACTIPKESEATEDTVEAQVQQCLSWWERSGRFSLTGQ